MCRRAAGGATREGSAERRACPTLALSSTYPSRGDLNFSLGVWRLNPKSGIWREPLITCSLLAHREAGLERRLITCSITCSILLVTSFFFTVKQVMRYLLHYLLVTCSGSGY